MRIKASDIAAANKSAREFWYEHPKKLRLKDISWLEAWTTLATNSTGKDQKIALQELTETFQELRALRIKRKTRLKSGPVWKQYRIKGSVRN